MFSIRNLKQFFHTYILITLRNNNVSNVTIIIFGYIFITALHKAGRGVFASHNSVVLLAIYSYFLLNYLYPLTTYPSTDGIGIHRFAINTR